MCDAVQAVGKGREIVLNCRGSRWPVWHSTKGNTGRRAYLLDAHRCIENIFSDDGREVVGDGLNQCMRVRGSAFKHGVLQLLQQEAVVA